MAELPPASVPVFGGKKIALAGIFTGKSMTAKGATRLLSDGCSQNPRLAGPKFCARAGLTAAHCFTYTEF